MTQQHDPNGELRSAFTMHMLENAKRSVQPETGPVGVFMRVTLAVVFMYLIVISYMMLGTIGLVFVSVLALVAYFVPHLYRALKGLLERRGSQKENRILGQESPQKG
jgi:hypothetical protein